MSTLERHGVVATILGLGLAATTLVLSQVGPAEPLLQRQAPIWVGLLVMILAVTGAWLFRLREINDLGDALAEVRPAARIERPEHDARVPHTIAEVRGWVGEIRTDRSLCVMVKPHGHNRYWLQCGGSIARQPDGTWYAHNVQVGSEKSSSGEGFDVALVQVTPKALAVIERHHRAGRDVNLPPGAPVLAQICVYLK